MTANTSTYEDSKNSMAKWVRNHGFAAKVVKNGVHVSLKNRRASRSEVCNACHLRDEYVIQDGEGVLIYMEDRDPLNAPSLRDDAAIVVGALGTFVTIRRPRRARDIRMYDAPTDSTLARLAGLMDKTWPTRLGNDECHTAPISVWSF